MQIHFLAVAQLGMLGILVVWNTYLGLEWNLYEAYWWWDIISHVLGGLWAGTCTAWLVAESGIRLTKNQMILLCAVGAVVAGAAWEWFEYRAGIQGSPYWSDQLEITKDMINDLVGGLIAGLIVVYHRKRKKAV